MRLQSWASVLHRRAARDRAADECRKRIDGEKVLANGSAADEFRRMSAAGGAEELGTDERPSSM
jgi:hypothetical protein